MSGSEHQELSSNARNPKTRTTGITTEYIYLSEIPSSGTTHVSSHAKENVRKVASSSRHSESTRGEDTRGEGGSAPYPNSKRPWKAGYITYLSAIEPQPQPTLTMAEAQGGGTDPHPTLRGGEPHSSLSGTRPLSLSHKPPAQTPERARARKDHTKPSAASDPRHSRHSQSSHSLRSGNGAELPRWEVEKAILANERVTFSGPIAAATWDHMQREVDSLRKTVQELHKVSRKQSKKIEELCTQATFHHQVLQGKDEEIRSLAQKCSKYEKFISTVEGAIQCQICMDLPNRPFTLAPCGHVLCLTCLQEWFKTSPGAVEDDDDEDAVSDILSREKTCPCCRTVVRHRPCPAFMVKDVTSTFLQRNGTEPKSNEAAASSDDDPWKGIFPNSDNEDDADAFTDDEDLDDDDDDDDEDDVGFWWMRNSDGNTASRVSWHGRYSSGSEDDGLYSEDGDGRPEEGAVEAEEEVFASEDEYDFPVTYILPRWEPPTVHVNPRDYGAEARDNVLNLLRRGCSWQMVQSFNVRYSHRHGIIIALRSIDHLYASDDDDDSGSEGRGGESLYHVYLGWNISLDEDDPDGEAYMDHVLDDIKARPERWRLIPRHDRQESRDVKRLVPSGSLEDYSTTDTDIWLNADEHDMDID